MRKCFWTILIILSFGPLVVCAAKGNREDVSIKDGKFNPAAVNVGVNDSVEWSNDYNRDHRIVADDGSFDSGKLKPGETFNHKFAAAGTFSYSCALHPREKGKVIVKK